MASHSSATARQDTPHLTTRTNTIMNALKQRAQAVLNDTSIDPRKRAIIRYALEANDPWLARLVRQTSEEESIVETIESNGPEDGGEDVSNRKKEEALAEIICGGGEEPAAALFVLMGTMQNATDPKGDCEYGEAFCFYSMW